MFKPSHLLQLLTPPPSTWRTNRKLWVYQNSLRLALIMVAQWCYTRALSFSTSADGGETPAGIKMISTVIPLHVWLVLWIASAALALLGVVSCRPGASIGCIIMSAVWAIGYTASWVPSWGIPGSSPGSQDYRFASTYWFGCLLPVAGYFPIRGALNKSTRGHGARADG